MQLALASLREILPQTAPDTKREVHAVLTESQREHHYLEGLDLLAWGRCHLGLSLQLDSSDTTLLLRTGTGRAWNVSGRKCRVQDMRSPYLLWERKGLLSIAPPYTGLSNWRLPILKFFVEGNRLQTLAFCLQSRTWNTLPWLKNIDVADIINKKFLMQPFPSKISIWSFCMQLF